jgi:hypothetical protein
LADASELRQGSIVWLTHVPDPKGRNPKPQPRPFVVISPTQDVRGGKTVVGIAVTSTFVEPVNDPAMVAMRWNSRGNIETGFRRKCFAKVDWAHAFRIFEGDAGPEFEGEYHGTYVRTHELEKILTALQQVRGDRS